MVTLSAHLKYYEILILKVLRMMLVITLVAECLIKFMLVLTAAQHLANVMAYQMVREEAINMEY